MSFVCWAWSDSLIRATTLYHRWNQGGTWVTSIAGGFSAKWLPNAPVGDWLWERSYLSSSNLVAEPFPSPFLMEGGRPRTEVYDPSGRHQKRSYHHDQWVDALTYPPSWKVIFIPYWLILLAVATLWLGLLFWRARRRNKAAINP